MTVSSTQRQLLLLILLLLVGFALRLFHLEAQSIWWDEGISLHLATSSLDTIFRDRLDNIHPPLYFAALKGWVSLVGVSPFAARYSSALASWLQIALVWAYARVLARRRTTGRSSSLTAIPWLAATLTVISAISVIYGQEIRVYAFLPLVYIGMLWAGERIVLDDDRSWRNVLLLAAITWLGLHLHYIALFGAAYVGLWGTLSLIRRRAWVPLSRLVIAFALCGVASLPWFVAVLGNWSAVQAEAGAGTYVTEAVPVPFLIAQVWGFQLTGLAGALSSQGVQALALVAAVLLMGLIAIRLVARPDAGSDQAYASGEPPIPSLDRPDLLRQLAHWLVPLSAAFLLWSLRSFSHPRYTIMFTIAFVPLVAVLAYPPGKRWASQMAVGGLLACVIALSFWGLGRYFFDQGAAKADMRAVAAYLQEEATAQDIVIIPDTDWSLLFEYDGAATIVMGTLGDSMTGLPPALQNALSCDVSPVPPVECATPVSIFMVDYERGTRDWQSRLPFELERRGTLVESTPIDELRVDRYRLNNKADSLPACQSDGPLLGRYGDLLLHDVWLDQSAATDSALTVAMCWSVAAATTLPVSVSLALDDPPARRELARADMALLDRSGRPTTQWMPGDVVLTYHVLPLPAGTPPLEYDVIATAYERAADGQVRPLELSDLAGAPSGQTVRLGAVTLQPGDPDVGNPYQQPDMLFDNGPVAIGPLKLRGVTVPPGPFQAGQSIPVNLLWDGPDRPYESDLQPALALSQNGAVLEAVVGDPVQDRFSTTQWPPGEPVAEVRYLTVPAGVSGEITLELLLDDASVLLGEREVVRGGATFSAPSPAVPLDVTFGDVVTLIGFDLPALTNLNDTPLPITFYWRAERDDVPHDYVVFAHLVDEAGRLIAQQDSLPGGSERPPTAWLKGEYITDHRDLVFREARYEGPAEVVVGLYDPGTGTRLRTLDGTDAFRLPVDVMVVASDSADRLP